MLLRTAIEFLDDHALVGALNLVEEYDVDVRLGALAEASRDLEAVEQVGVAPDVLELIRGGRDDKGSSGRSLSYFFFRSHKI